ncbi:cytosolic factor, phosphatidylinositol/phosphatidylcholine transfer protein [Thoreauomyces humboldtii]|nr:cytosolic factor, phosphatidylinositol/phosphatidylcholine transfer protein [Thoreauomyces humboldtii]
MSKSQVDLDALTDDQKVVAITQLRALLGADSEKYDDPTLLRFLIARQLDAAKAHEMILGYLEWRKNDGIDDLPVPGINGNPVQQCVRGFKSVPDSNWDYMGPGMPDSFKKFGACMGGGCFHKVDKEGTPIFIERTGYHDVKGLAVKCPQAAMLDWHIRNNEMIFNVLMPECSERIGKTVTKHTVIFDCTNLGLWQFDMTGLNLLRGISDLDSKVYPERLGKLFIVNTPGVFSRAWSIISRWLDKRILEKIFICGSDYKQVLLNHIEAENLPDFLGGTCTCSHMPGGCVPSPYLESKKASGGGDNFSQNVSLGSTPVQQEVVVTPQILEDASAVDLHYKFRSTKRAIQFEIKHTDPKTGAETVVLPSILLDSHKEIVQGSIPAQLGTYTLVWTKPAGGFSLFNSVGLEYSADLDLRVEEGDQPEAPAVPEPTV